jgi:hypothetical protein
MLTDIENNHLSGMEQKFFYKIKWLVEYDFRQFVTQVTQFQNSALHFCNTKSFCMKANLGVADRITRVIIAMAMFTLYLINVIEGTLAIVLLIIAALLALTAFISFCPIYFALHLRTNKKQ